MKKLLTLLLLSTSLLHAQCPVEGSATNDKDKIANRLKNRNITTKKIDSINLQQVLAPGRDSARFSNTSYSMIEGYVVEIKDGGKESCNCGAEADSLIDVHIYIGLTPTAAKEDCMIIEVTPKFKKLYPTLNLKKLKGKKVKIYGYMFYDEEHKGNAKNTCMKCTKVWRRTCWEIHPVVKIKEIK